MLTFSDMTAFEHHRDLPADTVFDRQDLSRQVATICREIHADPPGFISVLPSEDDTNIKRAAARIRGHARDLLLLGTGGSSLGAQAALSLTRFQAIKDGPIIHTPDSLCPYEMDRLLSQLEPKSTHILTVSKSGGTGETLAQLLCFDDWLRKAISSDRLGDHYTFITEPTTSPLRTFAEERQGFILDHHQNVGGRFSVLTNVGMLPAAIAGLDERAFIKGARDVLNGLTLDWPENTIAQSSALIQQETAFANRNILVLMPYIDALRPFTRWHGQLWAESLGKDGLGTTPVRAIGPVDQHSQLQLYSDGPDDKFYTFITIDSMGHGPRIKGFAAERYGLAYMADQTIGDMVTCQAKATIETLKQQGRPVREITISDLNEENLGALFMHFMLETIVTAQLMHVNAFDQPGVEDSKILTRKYLSDMKTQ